MQYIVDQEQGTCSGKDDDALREILMNLKVVDHEEGQKILDEYMEEIKKL